MSTFKSYNVIDYFVGNSDEPTAMHDSDSDDSDDDDVTQDEMAGDDKSDEVSHSGDCMVIWCNHKYKGFIFLV